MLDEKSPLEVKIAEQVNEALTGDEKLSAGAVWVNVENDAVTLAGTVADTVSANRAEQLVQALPDVQKVDNLLESIEDQCETATLKETEQDTLPKTPRQELLEQRANMTNEGGPPPDLPTPING